MNYDAPFLHLIEYQDACFALERDGFEAHAVGGCVRDALADYPCADIDIATNATPQQVQQAMESAGFVVYPTGIDHGTLTVRKGDWTFEITTYRYDVATDGRRATVRFAETMEEDAQRRDFTMNALYMGRDGTVYDPTGTGIDDLMMGYVRFVGDAEERCREDFLRIMRLFRFHAKYGGPEMDRIAADAAWKHKYGLSSVVSGERIWSELKKILSLPDPYEALSAMHKLGVLTEILPNSQFSSLAFLKMSERTNMFGADWARRYFALNGTDIPFPCANAEKMRLEQIEKALDNGYNIAVCTHLFGTAIAQDVHALRGKCGGWDHAEAARGESSVFPVKSTDLMQLGVEPGPEMGQLLRQAKDLWIETSLTAEKDDLLEMVLEV